MAKVKVDLRKSRLSRQLIRERSMTVARERGSLELQVKNGPFRQTMEVIERFQNGDTHFTIMDYDGEIIQHRVMQYDQIPLKEFWHKPIEAKPLNNAKFYLRRIVDIWYQGPENYYRRFEDRGSLDFDPIHIDPWEMPEHPLNCYRLSHDRLLVACCHSEALQTFLMTRRKLVRVSEIPTTGYRGLHTRDEIIFDTLSDAAARISDQRYQITVNNGFKRLDTCLERHREHILFD